MRKLGSIGLLLAGLLISVQALTFTNDAVRVVCSSQRPLDGRTLVETGIQLLSALTVLALGFLLVQNRERLSGRLFDESELDSTVDAVTLLRVGLILIGVWLIGTGIPSAISGVGRLISSYADMAPIQGNYVVFWMTAGSVIYPLVQFGVGIGLIMYSGRWAPRLLRTESAD